MSLLIAVPIHGYGETSFWLSISKLQETLLSLNLEHDFLIIENESLIQRARNNAVTSFLETDYQRLLFIDSDIQFEPDDVAKLWNLEADVAVGCYAMKRPDEPYVTWKNRKIVNLDNLKKPTEVDYAGTGFMMIRRQVFLDMMDKWPDKWFWEGKPTDNINEHRKSFLWFDPRLDKKMRIYLSEDYAFCKDVKQIGKKIMLDPSIKLKHWGKYGYGG